MRTLDTDDLKYLFAAWRMGKVSFDGFEPDGMTAGACIEAFALFIQERYQVAYTLIANVPGKGVMPVGVVFGIVPLLGKRIIWCGDFTWFPWASKRNKLESTVHFLNQVRKEWLVLGFANMDEVPFFEHVCRYGVLRRIGTVFDMLIEGPTAVFQTRKPYKG